MSEKELHEHECCGGKGHHEHGSEGCCGGKGHGNGEGCGCGHDHSHGEEEFQHLVVDLEKEDGTIVTCDIVDSFEYKENEYILVEDPDGEVFLFKAVGDDEEGELIVPDEDEFEEVKKYYEEELAE